MVRIKSVTYAVVVTIMVYSMQFMCRRGTCIRNVMCAK